MNVNTKEKMCLSPVELADELCMAYGDYLIVEGERDKLFWEHLQNYGLKKRNIRVANKKECSGNKEYVGKVITMMNERNKKNVVGVIDFDYDYVIDKTIKKDNLFYYKYIDLENVLINSDSFSEVNKMISSSNKKKSDDELKRILYEKSYIVGIMRLLNCIEGYNFSFEELDYKKLISGTKEDFLMYFMSKEHIDKERRVEVNSKYEKLFNQDYDVRYICNGHDMLNVLSLLTKREIATNTRIKHTEDVLGQMLVLGFREEENVYDVQECCHTIFKLDQEEKG